MLDFRELDRVLRGEGAAENVAETLDRTRVLRLMRVNLVLAVLYGACMGTYGLFSKEEPAYLQFLATMIKVPALFFLTLLVTFPSLYVFNTLLGSRLRFSDLADLVVSGMSVLLAVLAAFGPIVAFFSLTTTSYPFILLLNVVVFATSGGLGMVFLYRGLGARMAAQSAQPLPTGTEKGNRVFVVWMVLFGLVGAQMGWVLRPFVGSPDLPFTWFRAREASFFEGVSRALQSLFGG